MMAAYGHAYTYDVKSRYMGMRALESCIKLQREFDLPVDPEAFLEERNANLDLAFPGCEKMPGVMRLLRHLKHCGVHSAIATSSSRHHFEIKTTRHKDMLALVEHIVTGDDPRVKRGKPCPDIFHVAAQGFQVPPSSLVSATYLCFPA